MKLLIHTSPDPAQCVIDGRPFLIPPNKVFKVPADMTSWDHNNNGPQEYLIPEDYLAKKLMEHCWHYGLVEVPVIEKEGDFGVSYNYDAPAALEAAKQKLIQAEEQILMNYVEISQSRMSQQLPALPPSKTVDAVIRRRGIDIAKEYNIKPVGYGVVAQAASTANELIEARAESAELRQRLERLEAAITNQKNGKKGD